ncbi:MAG: rod shape-determining protein MreC [bacterium]|jgi:rod shape-determining protein MreC|nr:rod shape-determining protein MreC [bacterium]
MRGLLQLFAAYGNFLLFGFLELLALILVVSFNQRQGAIWDNSWGMATAMFDQSADWLGEQWALRDEMIKLQGENIRLMEQLDNARYSNAVRQDTFLRDSTEQLFTYIPANVISNSTIGTANYLRLDKGSNHGVRPNMGVISSDGIVGVVRAVTPHYSQVMSLLHRETRIKAALSRSGYFGTLTWNGKNARLMQLEAIPKHAVVAEGDTVVTSGYSQLFPQGLAVGTVKSFDFSGGGNFYNIQVMLRNDLNKLRYVYVIENEMWKEHKELDEAVNE